MKRSDIVKTVKGLQGEEGHKKVLDVYNGQCPLPRGYKLQEKDPWCAATVTAVFLMNGYDAFAECSCPVMIQKAKKLGIWVEEDGYIPSPGDVIMYDWQDSGKGDDWGTADHTGIVISVSKNKIVVREGNKNKSIGNRDVTVNGLYIRGYITPRFDSESKKGSNATNSSTSNKNSNDKAPAKSEEYIIGKTYTVAVKTSLNVRTGPATNYMLVGYKGLTADGKKHATPNGALLPGTRVTCLEIKNDSYGNTWIKIPSGWICGISGGNVYVE